VTDPWELARAKAHAANVTLAALTTVEDADLVNQVIAATWGGQHMDREVVRALAISGNVSWGAFDGETLIGFVLGWAGVDVDGLHVHSHMLAAVPDRRHAGVGEALKLAQRAQALEQGIEVVRWTFDPMVARNAWLNLGKLGVVIDRFARNFYGDMTDSINTGERSDRFTVGWPLRREPGPHRVREQPDAVLLRTGDDALPRPHLRSSAGLGAQAATIEIPAEYHDLRSVDPALAGTWRDAVAEASERCLGAGMQGVAFDREHSAYVFAHAGALEADA
jgi:predicted GNAT superfamily acetyltransferase